MGNEEKIYEDESVSKLLSSLKRVEAPGDFDFGVKARIAKGKPSDRPASWLPASVRVAMPIVLLVLVGGYFAFNAIYSRNVAVVPPVDEAKSTPVVETPSTPTVSAPKNDVAINPDIKSTQTADKGKILAAGKKPSSTDKTANSSGGSFDEAARVGRRIFPRGLDPNSRSSQIPARDVLTLIGVTGTFDASGCNVNSVRANSIAARSGVKGGDVIESFNGQPLSEKTTFGNRTSLKSVSVRRDGKTLQIGLKP